MAWPWPARLALLSVIWGSSFLLIKVSDRSFSPVEVAGTRIATGAVVLVAILFAQRSRLPRGLRLWGHLAVVGLLMNVLPFCLFAWGEHRVTSVAAGILNATTPLFVVPITLLAVPEERPTRAKIAGIVIGFVGVSVVVGAWNGLSAGHLDGDLACLVAAASYGVGIPYTRRFIVATHVSATALAAGQLVAAMVEMALVAPFLVHLPAHVEGISLASVVVLGAFGTGIAYVLNYSIVREAGATNASLVTYTNTIVATVLGVAVLGEAITWSEPVGAAIVLAGVAVSQGRTRHWPRGRQPGVRRARGILAALPASEEGDPRG